MLYYRSQNFLQGSSYGLSVPRVTPDTRTSSTNSSSSRSGQSLAWNEFDVLRQDREFKLPLRFLHILEPDPIGPDELEAQPTSCYRVRHDSPHLQKETHRAQSDDFVVIDSPVTTSREDLLSQRLEDTKIRLDNVKECIKDIDRELESLHIRFSHLAEIVGVAMSGTNEVATGTQSRPVSYEEFIHSLAASGEHDYLLQHARDLDPYADYAVAPTNDPRKRRCKVGRPVGKILRPPTDDLNRRLCDLHKDEVGLRIRVEEGADPWKCLPVNIVDKDDQR